VDEAFEAIKEARMVYPDFAIALKYVSRTNGWFVLEI